MADYAPIGLSTYTRIEHLRQTVGALKNNALAKQTDLYVFSDAPRPGDEQKVQAVRDFAHQIKGFRNLVVLERETNSRVNNNRGGIRQLLEEYGRCIFLEEDVVTAPGFLSYMNAALSYYEGNEKVLSVGAHSPPLKVTHSYQGDVYFVKRFHPWGCGFWRYNFDRITALPPVNEVRAEPNLKRNLDRMGTDLYPMVLLEAGREIDALDIRSCYLMNKEDLYMVIPARTLARNIGLDGSGAHGVNLDPYATGALSGKTAFSFLPEIRLDEAIMKEYQRFYARPGLIHRLQTRLRRLFN